MKQCIELIDFKVHCLIGVLPHERVKKQDVFVDVYLEGDWSLSHTSDRVSDTVDYDALSQEIATALEEGQFQLIEKAAFHLAELCLAIESVKKVTLRLKKPCAIPDAQHAAYKITLS